MLTLVIALLLLSYQHSNLVLAFQVKRANPTQRYRQIAASVLPDAEAPNNIAVSSSIPSQEKRTLSADNVNFPLDGVKNMRDLASVSDRIANRKILRTGCVSKASQSDVKYLREELDIKVLVDLRSDAELEEDEELYSAVYDGFENVQYDAKKGVFVPNNPHARKEVSSTGSAPAGLFRRFFVSIMSESLIKKGVFMRMRKRRRFQALVLYLAGLFSRRAESKVRGMFIGRINSGGLTLLNELVVDVSGKPICEVLKLSADPRNHPIALYCTAGKDRTGLISMLIMHVLGASDEEILADYVLSDSAYKDINDNKAMVASLKQVDVDPNTFLRAKPEVMLNTMQYIRDMYGSINEYLDHNGFDESWRQKLRESIGRTATESTV